MEDVGRFYGHLIYFVALWYIFPVLVCCTKKNLATLQTTRTFARIVAAIKSGHVGVRLLTRHLTKIRLFQD
jgi:hypothetical protein